MANHRVLELSIVGKIILVVAVVTMMTLSWFTVRRTLGVTLSSRADSRELADIAVGLAPDYGFAHVAAGKILDKTFIPEDLLRSQSEFERAVALSPHDFRLWVELARSYEKNGDSVKAESAFRRSLELAPNYSRVQWTVGNFLLRQEKAEEAFSLIRSAAEKEFALAAAAAAVAWNIYDGDLATIESFFAGSDFLRAGLAAHLSNEGRFDDALRVWTSLPGHKRDGELKATSELIYAKLLEAKRFILVLRMDELAGRAGRSPGSVANPGFEEEIGLSDSDRFGWQVADGTGAQIGVDVQQMREGMRQRTLAMVFNSDGKSFRGVSQLVPVEPGRQYSLKLAYRSDLKSSATVRWEIVNASDSALLAATEPLAERSDWTEAGAQFEVPDKSEGVLIRLVRVGCIYAACPLMGNIWFDDVVLSQM